MESWGLRKGRTLDTSMDLIQTVTIIKNVWQKSTAESGCFVLSVLNIYMLKRAMNQGHINHQVVEKYKPYQTIGWSFFYKQSCRIHLTLITHSQKQPGETSPPHKNNKSHKPHTLQARNHLWWEILHASGLSKQTLTVQMLGWKHHSGRN